MAIAPQYNKIEMELFVDRCDLLAEA